MDTTREISIPCAVSSSPCARGNYELRILPRYQHHQEEINGMVSRMFLAGVSIRRVGGIIAEIKG